MAVSSNALFHFTSTIDTLEKILRSRYFLPRYCVEYDKGIIENDCYYAIPMVCFCDIPLSNIQDHTKDYGKYGIGMYKGWAKDKIAPITYYKEKSTLSKKLYDNISPTITTEQKMQWFSLLKRYYGETWSLKKRKYIHKVLYNEREWRYVPILKKGEERYKEVNDVVAFNRIRMKESKPLEAYPLKFSYDEIKYIFVKDKKDRSSIVDLVASLVGKVNKINILTINQIREDF